MRKVLRGFLTVLLLVTACLVNTKNAAAISPYHELVRIGRPAFTGMAWSPDGKTLAVGYNSGVLLYANHTWDNTATLQADPDVVAAFGWNPRGGYLAAAGRSLWLWNVANGRKLTLFPDNDASEFGKLVWSPDGTRFVTDGEIGAAIIWNASTGKPMGALPHNDAIQDISWSPDGNRIASSDGQVHIWDARSYQLETTFAAASNAPVHTVSWSPDGALLASASAEDGSIEIRDAKSFALVKTLTSHKTGFVPLTWRPDGGYLVTADDKIHIWDTQSWVETRTFASPGGVVSQLDWGNGGVLASFGTNLVSLWDPDAGKRIHVIGADDYAYGPIAWNPNSQEFAVGIAGEDRGIQIRDANSGNLTVKIATTEDVNLLAWNPKSSWLAASDGRTAIRLWDRATGKFVRSVTSSLGSRLAMMAWSSDGTRLAACDYDGTITVWSADNWQIVRQWNDYASYSHAFSWSPFANLLAATDKDGLGQMLDVSTGKAVGTLQSTADKPVRSISWSPAGDSIAGEYGVPPPSHVAIWNVQSGSIAGYAFTSTNTTVIAWSPDGKQIAVAWDGGQTEGVIEPDQSGISITNADGQDHVDTAPFEGPIEYLAWSPDGKRLMSVSSDFTLRIWGQ